MRPLIFPMIKSMSIPAERLSQWKAAVGLGLVLLIAGRSCTAQNAQKAPCASSEYRQLDFWVGDWDAFEITGRKTPAAHLRVEKILNGCVLKEAYDGANGLHGQSFSIYDRTRGVWHQSWVTSSGQLLIIEGGLQNGKIVLSGADKTADGKDRLVRGTWAPQGNDVRETAVRSIDGGKTWEPWFDLIFKPAKSSQKKR